MSHIRMAVLIAFVVLGSTGSAQAFEVTNNSNRSVWAAVIRYHQGSTQPDVTYSHWTVQGWYEVGPGQVANLGGSGGAFYARLTYDSGSGPLIHPRNPNGNPVSALVHPQKAFEIDQYPRNSGDSYVLQVNNQSLGTHSHAEAVQWYGFKDLDGFYQYNPNTRFTVGGDRPPAGTTRTIGYTFEYRAGAMDSTRLNERFDIPAGAQVATFHVDVDSERRAIVYWDKQPGAMVLKGSVYGESSPFGAGGVYKGRITITYRY